MARGSDEAVLVGGQRFPLDTEVVELVNAMLPIWIRSPAWRACACCG